MRVLLPLLQILGLLCMNTLWWSVQGMTTQSPEAFDARLVNGPRSSEGRVEVYYQGQWGTVCDNLWTITEANVLCKQLGYIGADQVVIAGQFGQGDGDVLLDMVNCTGIEANLFDCLHSEIGSTTCDNTEDVGVICTSTGSLRLQDGTSYRNGRLEILTADQEWGTVCNQSWDIFDEFVACDQLGFERGVPDTFAAPSGTGPIGLGGLECLVEERLDECPRDIAWTPESCSHIQDVGLECPSLVNFEGEDYTEEGIPIVYYGGKWGSICADHWNIDAARIFCLNMGFDDALSAGSEDPGETKDILLNPIRCTGEEDYFTDCSQVEWAYQDGCSQPEINATVRCQLIQKWIKIVPISDDDPLYTSNGRVEVVYDSESIDQGASICDRTFTQEAANVVCRDAGYERGAQRFFTVGGGTGDKVFDNIRCTGNEESFSDCRSELVSASSDCDHSHDVGVECIETPLIKFLSGEGDNEGVVLYPGAEREALICDETWTDTEAAVACRMLGYEGGTTTNVVDLRPQPFTDIFQWDIVCNGDEERLEDCTVTKTDNPTTCAPENIAQVQCEPIADRGNLRMAGSDSPEQGRLEYFTDNEWVSIWVDEDTEVAAVIYDEFCKAMGYEAELYHYRGADQMPFEQGDEGARLLWSGEVEILPSDSALDRNYQTGIVCKPFDVVAYHPIRLVDRETGEISNESGLVEIYNEGEWGNVCQYEGYYYSSDKVCSELGYEDATNTAHLEDGESMSKEWFSVSPGSLTGTCRNLYGCPHTAWGHILDDCIPLAVHCALSQGIGCSSDPCQNGGTCFVSDSGSSYTCRCQTGFNGDSCENRGSSLEGLALSLIVMVVIVTFNLVSVDV